MVDLLRVVQLNAGSLLEPDWDKRRHEIVAWLDHLQPDIVCFQEIWADDSHPSTAHWLAEASSIHWHVVFGGRSFGKALWPDPSMLFGSAILSRWPIEENHYVRLEVLDTGGTDTVATQVPWELFHARTAGLDVFSTHLAAAPTEGNHRRAQVMAIDEHITSIRAGLDPDPVFGSKRQGMPAILCGDFNAEPDSDEIRFLSSLATIDGKTTFWQDAWRMAGTGVGYTQDWRTNPIAESMNIHAKRIDYIFVGDGFQRAGSAGRVMNAELVFNEPRTGILASDHFGLMAEIVWPTRP